MAAAQNTGACSPFTSCFPVVQNTRIGIQLNFDAKYKVSSSNISFSSVERKYRKE